MATLEFSFQTGAVPLTKIVNAICNKYGYKDGEETKAQFATRMIKEHIINIVKMDDIGSAVKTAREGVTSIELT